LKEQGTNIILKELLVEDRWDCKAQIWKATVRGKPVVAKIYQACFVGEAPSWISASNRVWDFYPEEEEAHREAWAFGRLHSLQGSVIPYSYGFFDVVLPSSDVACVHIMEFIGYKTIENSWLDHETVPEVPKDILSPSDVLPPPAIVFAVDMLMAIMEVQRLGVIHSDIVTENFLLTPEGSRPSMVLIDFGSSRPKSMPGVGTRCPDVRLELEELSTTLSLYFHSLQSMRDWIRYLSGKQKDRFSRNFLNAIPTELNAVLFELDSPE